MRDTHQAWERYVGDDEDGVPVYQPVMCGEWHGGETMYCDEHEAELVKRYPQGWAYYAGDTCHHGVYVGGVGIDYMCHNCEMGYNTWVADATYELRFAIAGGLSSDVPNVSRWMDSSIIDKVIELKRFFAQPVWSTPEILALNPEWHVVKVSAGYWTDDDDA